MVKLLQLSVLLILLGCSDRQPPGDKAAQCDTQARNQFPQAEGEDSIRYSTDGPAADMAEACMKAQGYAHGGPRAAAACYREPDVGSSFKAECYYPL